RPSRRVDGHGQDPRRAHPRQARRGGPHRSRGTGRRDGYGPSPRHPSRRPRTVALPAPTPRAAYRQGRYVGAPHRAGGIGRIVSWAGVIAGSARGTGRSVGGSGRSDVSTRTMRLRLRTPGGELEEFGKGAGEGAAARAGGCGRITAPPGTGGQAAGDLEEGAEV